MFTQVLDVNGMGYRMAKMVLEFSPSPRALSIDIRGKKYFSSLGLYRPRGRPTIQVIEYSLCNLLQSNDFEVMAGHSYFSPTIPRMGDDVVFYVKGDQIIHPFLVLAQRGIDCGSELLPRDYLYENLLFQIPLDFCEGGYEKSDVVPLVRTNTGIDFYSTNIHVGIVPDALLNSPAIGSALNVSSASAIIDLCGPAVSYVWDDVVTNIPKMVAEVDHRREKAVPLPHDDVEIMWNTEKVLDEINEIFVCKPSSVKIEKGLANIGASISARINDIERWSYSGDIYTSSVVSQSMKFFFCYPYGEFVMYAQLSDDQLSYRTNDIYGFRDEYAIQRTGNFPCTINGDEYSLHFFVVTHVHRDIKLIHAVEFFANLGIKNYNGNGNRWVQWMEQLMGFCPTDGNDGTGMILTLPSSMCGVSQRQIGYFDTMQEYSCLLFLRLGHEAEIGFRYEGRSFPDLVCTLDYPSLTKYCYCFGLDIREKDVYPFQFVYNGYVRNGVIILGDMPGLIYEPLTKHYYTWRKFLLPLMSYLCHIFSYDENCLESLFNRTDSVVLPDYFGGPVQASDLLSFVVREYEVWKGLRISMSVEMIYLGSWYLSFLKHLAEFECCYILYSYLDPGITISREYCRWIGEKCRADTTRLLTTVVPGVPAGNPFSWLSMVLRGVFPIQLEI